MVPWCANVKLCSLGRWFLCICCNVINRFHVFSKNTVVQSQQRVIRLQFHFDIICCSMFLMTQRRWQIVVLDTHLDCVAQNAYFWIFLLLFQLAFFCGLGEIEAMVSSTVFVAVGLVVSVVVLVMVSDGDEAGPGYCVLLLEDCEVICSVIW